MIPLIFIATMLMLAMQPEAAVAVMPGLAALIGTAVIVTQIVKKVINAINIGYLKRVIVQETGAIVLAVLVAVGTVAYYVVVTKTPFDFGLTILAAKVAFASPILKRLFSR